MDTIRLQAFYIDITNNVNGWFFERKLYKYESTDTVESKIVYSVAIKRYLVGTI